eukprot:Gb_26949 [translate_table: standard]
MHCVLVVCMNVRHKDCLVQHADYSVDDDTVVNGFFEAGKPVCASEEGATQTTSLGLIPLGTGSDFARTFGWKNDPYEAIERISLGQKQRIDIGIVIGKDDEIRYFVNVADVHLSAKAGYYASMYKRFGKLCYVIGALHGFIGHKNLDMNIKIDEEEWKTLSKVTALCIGNAKYFGGGMKITPTADPRSGKFEVVALQDFKWYDFILKLQKLYKGTHLSERNVSTMRSHAAAHDIYSRIIVVESIKIDGCPASVAIDQKI